MKRTSLLLIPILLIALLLCSCNADAQDGIFSAIADSAPDAGIKVQAYLGTTGGNHYILTDSGVNIIGNSDVFTPILSTSDAQVKNACLLTDFLQKHIYVAVSKQGSETGNDSKLLRYTVNGTYEAEADSNVKWLTTNGIYYTETESENAIHLLHSSNSISLDGKATTKVESEDYVLIEEVKDSTKTLRVYSSKTGEILNMSRPSSLKGEVVGFQVVSTTSGSESFLIVVKNGSTYEIHSLSSTEIKDTGSYLSSSPANGNILSFHYTNDGKDYVVFKTANYFDLLTIDGTSYKMETTNTAGYASKLRTATVTNIVPSNNAGKFIIATWNNSVWEIAPKTTDDPVELM